MSYGQQVAFVFIWGKEIRRSQSADGVVMAAGDEGTAWYFVFLTLWLGLQIGVSYGTGPA